jgi:DNA modification methylase
LARVLEGASGVGWVCLMAIQLLAGDCRATLATLPERSVQTVITSPPYWGLRDYGTDPLVWDDGWLGSLGLEPTPELFVEHIVEVFRAVRRVLRDDGTLWVNMGDSYAGSGKGPTGWNGIGNQARRQGFAGGPDQRARRSERPREDVKPKSLMMIPAKVAIALEADGWYLRSQIPWLKRNSMPESVTDRPATAVEYVYLFSKSSRYYYDADAVRVAGFRAAGVIGNRTTFRGGSVYTGGKSFDNSASKPEPQTNVDDGVQHDRARRNSDWFFESWQGLLLDEQDEPLALVVNPAGYSGAHFATFPLKLVEPMVKASTSERGCCPECGAPWVRVVEKARSGTPLPMVGKNGALYLDGTHGSSEPQTWNQLGHAVERLTETTGWRPSCKHEGEPVPQTVLDPFGGSGSTGLVADRLGRNAILCELKPDYLGMGEQRLMNDGPMFMEIDVA